MVGRIGAAAVLVSAVLALNACTSSEPVQPAPEPTFANLPPLGLNVAAIDVDSRYQSPMTPPNVEHRFTTTPEAAMKLWASQRLRAAGDGQSARFTILDASVTEESLPTTGGVAGALRTEPTEKYTAVVEGELAIFDRDGRRLGLCAAKATRTRTANEETTGAVRQRLWAELTEAVINDFDAEMEKAIREYLGAWVM